ncbi:cyclic nucleotide-binding domain protein (macronuclear) [Tetrahymena thermophila SB210]|uniref:Cyclic nucleotide-binding domain protein n=1 Tax=Tetrahymena thermophila (strain SB210) TaxID=312017 RepID=I7LV79_TETTS|nr:cyclic nucleotide-binding domain protein [Tetrahymena thermophila SB210]EAR97382.3 cyclic nucleotide-binding domain protein [Tetrahymena thermophila SB210]|eukprot:XP_001017627.3 cyclic nucleotide-binding domain protein [Tetrahymena thermophila SB210]
MSNNNNNDSMEVDINYDIIYEIVKKNPKDRSPDNIKYLMRLPVDILRESINPYAQLYARYFEFEEHKQNKQIFASKQRKNGVYWIIEGQFAVYNKKNIIIRAYKNLDYLSQNDIMNEFEDFQEVRALENTKLGYISDRTITEIIEPLKKEARWQLHDFLSCTPLLCTWTFNQIKFLLTFFNTLTFGKNSYVFQEKQESTAVYFVKDGIFDIRKNFSGAADYDDIVSKEGIVIKDLPLSKIQKLQMKEFKISTLNLGDYFGEEDVLTGNNRSFSVLCNSLQGEVVYIQAEHFIEFIYKDLFCRSTIDQKAKKKEQLFQKREINIKGSLNNYGNFLVNEHFNKNLDQIITELAIQPQVKTYNEIQKEQVIKQMQSLTNIQGASPRRNKGLIRNETLADIEELSDEAVAKMVNNNLFSKKRVQTEQKIEEIPDVPEKQILTIQDEDNKIQNPDQIQNRVDELVRINKQGKQNFLYDWRSKKNKEPSHNRTPSEQYQKDAMEEYGSNPPSQPAERASYQNNLNNEYYLDDDNSPKRQNKNSSNSPLQRANTKFLFSYAQNQNSSPHSPRIVSMTDLFRFNTENADDQFKAEKLPFPQMIEKNPSQQNTGRLINIIPTVQKPLQKQNTLNLQLTDRQRSQVKSQNQNDQNFNVNTQISDQVGSSQITNQPSNQELQSESNIYKRLYSSSQSPSRNEKMPERDSTKMKKIMEQMDDKFQVHHSNLQNQCQNFFTNPTQNNNQVQLKMIRQNSSKSPELKNGLLYEQQDELQQPDIIQLRNQSSSGSSNQLQQKATNVRIQTFELKDIQIQQPQLQKKNNNLDSSSPTYKFMESPQFTGQKSSQDTVKLSQKNSTNSKLGLSSSPRLKNISSSSFTSNLFNQPNNSRINKNISFVEKIRSNVKGSFSNDKNNYFKQTSNDTPNYSDQPNLIQGAKSVSSVFHDYKNNQIQQKKQTLNDLYISQFQRQRSIEGNDDDDDNDQQKNSLSLIQEDSNIIIAKQNANTFNFINSPVEENLQLKSPNMNRPLSSERKENSAFQNGYDFSNIQAKTTQNQDLSSRRLLFYKTNTNFSHYKPQFPSVNRQAAIQNQNLSQKLLSERYQKFKLQHSQIKKQNPQQAQQANQLSQASQNQIEDINSKPVVTSISNISQVNTFGNNFSHNFISNQTVERQSQNDSVNENLFYHSNKTQKIITNKPTARQENYSSNQNIFQKRAKSQNVLPPTTSYNDYKQMQKEHLASPQDHLQKLLDKKEKMFRKHLFSSQGGQSQILQQTNHEINNPYFNTYIQLDYMNAYKISQAKPKTQVGGNLSATSQIIKYIPMSPDKKKIPDYPEKIQNRSGTRSNNRQLVS